MKRNGLVSIVVSGLTLFASSLQAQIGFADFNGMNARVNLLVDAFISDNHRLVLTDWQQGQRGGAFYFRKVKLNQAWSTTFVFAITPPPDSGGADGFALVIQGRRDAPEISYDAGGSIGYGGLANSLAVEFDTWKNFDYENFNHVAIHTRWTETNTVNQDGVIAYNGDLQINLKDGKPHVATVTYDGLGLLVVYLDGQEVVRASFPTDLLDDILDDGYGWIGFTAATGGQLERHEIWSWSINPRCFIEEDIDGNGSVDDADLLRVLFNFGTGCEP